MADSKLDEVCVNTIRCLSIDMVQKANSGHPGMPLGMAPAAHVLFTKFLRFSSKNHRWPNRDRFVLSNGHGCALLYTMLHLCGYKVSMDDLKQFRQIDSITPGHPECHVTEGVEVSTGPLGQGVANAVGLAMAREHAAATFNKDDIEIVDHRIFAFCGDGDLQEGVASEAASLAGHLKLRNLVVIYDDNRIQIDGDTHMTFTEDVPARFRAYGWKTLTIENGDRDLVSIESTIAKAVAEAEAPVLISLKTTIGFGSVKAGSESSHGSPLGVDNVKATKAVLGAPEDKHFHVPESVQKFYDEIAARGQKLEAEWNKKFAQYKDKYPEEAAEFDRIFVRHTLPDKWQEALPVFQPGKSEATRATSGEVLNALANIIPELIGGSADLTGSNKTALKCTHDFQPGKYDGRYFRFGVREFAMAAIGNGISTYGYIPFTATFLNFITYAWGAVRLGALSQLRQIYIMTHDSICLGEDGPTHQPVEVLPLLRATPNVVTIRPADGNETSGAYRVALERTKGPTVLALSRQGLPHLENSHIGKVEKGAYTLHETTPQETPDLILIASGSEVSLALDTANQLQDSLKVRVVSCPSTDLFAVQSGDYRRSVLPLGVPIVSIETSANFGWSGFAHFHVGMTTFGGSAPAKHLQEKFGFTTEKVAAKCKGFLESAQTFAKEHGRNEIYSVLECQL